MDYFQSVGELGLGSRLKRLSDSFMVGSKKIYEMAGYDFEPRWFPLFSLLLKEGATTVSSAAEQLNITHPHVSQMAKELEKEKFVTWRVNPSDGRSRTMILTPKGKDFGEQIQPLWDDIKNAARSVVQDVDARFMERLETLERSLRESPFEKRVLAEKKRRLRRECKIVAYDRSFQKHFESLNREWIEQDFAIESNDVRLFKNPDKEIIQSGGNIIFAMLGDHVVGTCALLYSKEHGYELAKLAVTKEFKGLGIGEILCLEIIDIARRKGAKTLSLTTNSRLIPAVQLYEKLGFSETFRGKHAEYNRVDLCMELKL